MTSKVIGTLGCEFPDSSLQITAFAGGGNPPLPLVRFSTHKSSTSSINTGGTIVFNAVSANDGGGYDSINGIFTAPVTGNYLFIAAAEATATGSLTQPFLNIVHNAISLSGARNAPVGPTSAAVVDVMAMVQMTLGDTVRITFNVGTGTGLSITGSPSSTRFAGHLISAN